MNAWDGHVHLLHPGDAPRLLDAADRHGIAVMCISSLGRKWVYDPPHENCKQANRDVARAVKKYPGRFRGFCYVNPAHGRKATDELRRCVLDDGMVGLKLWVARRATDRCVTPVVECAIELGVPILHHAMWKAMGLLPQESLPAEVAALAARFPEANFIMAHMGGEWTRGVRWVADLPHVWVDTSGCTPESAAVTEAAAVLGSERVIFGSDAPGRGFAPQLAKVVGAHLGAAATRRILCTNLRQLLGED